MVNKVLLGIAGAFVQRLLQRIERQIVNGDLNPRDFGGWRATSPESRAVCVCSG